MQHRNAGSHEGGFCETDPHMFCGTLKSSIERVEIKGRRILNIARHHGTLEKMYIVHIFHDPGRIINIGKM